MSDSHPPQATVSGLQLNARLQMDGLKLLAQLQPNSVAAAFFDPQYRGILDKLSYGNEGKSRGRARSALAQMDEAQIIRFVSALNRVLQPSGHLFLWTDKYHLCTDFSVWIKDTELAVVDLLTWHKDKIGMGYRTRRAAEYLIVLQKSPRRAKGVWTSHTIPDVWTERAGRGTHAKPIKLQTELIAATTKSGDLVVDPAAGTFSVLEACKNAERSFLGCDLNG